MCIMQFGNLNLTPVTERMDLVAAPVAQAIQSMNASEIFVTEIDPAISDTAAFCTHYNTPLDRAVNCIILEATRADKKWLAACCVLGAKRADVNGLVRRMLDARRASFAPREVAVSETKMEFGAIGPIGLPAGMKILIDKAVIDLDRLIIGSGMRNSKLVTSGKILGDLPGVVVLENLGR